MLERILLGYGGDDAGRDGAVLAAQLASLCEAELSVAFPYHPLLASTTAEVAERRVREELEALTDTPLAQIHWSNASWPIRALHELAVFEGVALIVLGAARGQREHLMERMVHGAPCAVAIAPEGYAERAPRRLPRIGVGFADTPEGHAALALGGELARIAGCEERVIAGSGLSPGLASYAAGSPALGPAEEELERETEAALERALSGIPHALRTTRELRRGDPRGALLDACAQLDLLVLGSRGYGPVRHALLGGVSADVMRAAACPVLVLARGPSSTTGAAGAQRAALAES